MGGSGQKDYLSSGGCTSPAKAGLGQGEGIIEPLDSGDQSLSVTRFKKTEEMQKRRYMKKEHLQEQGEKEWLQTESE